MYNNDYRSNYFSGTRAINSLCKCSLSLYRSFCVQHFYLFPFSETGFFNLQGTIRNTINLFNVYLLFIHLLVTLFKLTISKHRKAICALISHTIGICHDRSVMKFCSKSFNWLKSIIMVFYQFVTQNEALFFTYSAKEQ